ncbi:tRNA cytosine(34) acetyltransferase TmcA [Mixta theicola]|uniref:tRNA(Met) cytidine acetyltransferase TmcA n=1 Tax=Mixta theicola TaxID=1458355 RepID=A0A2K1Q8H4_9GAMM|nr:GNAT family N-acetyltransferase [Mixta theicola]PNS11334.1 tRNA cytosine(34) acetyltransferase TmcA [Mixta theicola]GLR10511.1 tRNA(Met) cytidine acetyltransferase TmcA [Mixta theicola]
MPLSVTAEMQRAGIRRLAAIAGEPDWCYQQAQRWQQALAGDWLFLSEDPQLPNSVSPSALRNLLGQEFRHAIFDARQGFHSEAFAALAGTLSAGSWLLLLTPPWDRWPQRPDSDSLRWSENDTPIATPHFIHHLQRQLCADEQVLLHRQHHPCRLPPSLTLTDWRPAAAQQQQSLLTHFLQASPGIYVLTAARGRGKSALAGMLMQRWPGRCLVTAPAKVSTAVLARFAGERFAFIAPDALLASAAPPEADWLIIDEAAAIPAPLLQRLITCFPRVLLTTTVQGYEGTGRGFLLKFCAALPQAHFYQLDEPLRWRQGDPLERWVNTALMLDEAKSAADSATADALTITGCGRDDGPRLLALYQLLTSAHYRTTPLDLRRIMDAPGQRFIAAKTAQGEMGGAVWLVAEGGLSAALAWQVWAGLRRPRGNLVAQSLAAHAGFPQAAQLRSQRISRIAVAPDLRRQQVGSRMIDAAREQAQGLDYLSVSFGFTHELWRFWQRCGFILMRIATQREASSGCYSAMAILPLSEAGEQLSQQAQQQLARDLFWLQPLIDEPIPLTIASQQPLNEADWQTLAGFAFAHRPFEVSLPALGRLLLTTAASEELALHQAIIRRRPPSTLCRELALSGRKALLVRWRDEAGKLMQQLDAARCLHWKEAVAGLQ